MNSDEMSIIGIEEDTERSTELRRYLSDSRAELSDDFVEKLLNDRYDVVRCEILDYLTESGHRIAECRVESLIRNEGSEIVRGRLFLLAGRCKYFDVLSKNKALSRSEYEQLYWTAGASLARRDMQDLLRLCVFLFSEEAHIAETAVDLVVFVTTADEDAFVSELFKLMREVNPSIAPKIEAAELAISSASTAG